MSCPDMASKRWVWEQYDRHVMGDTVDSSQSQGNAAIVRIHGTNKALAITSDCTPRYVSADPYEGGKQAVAEAYRNLSAVGAKPIAITDNLNFGNPEKPETMGYIVKAIEGMAEACGALDFPVVSGNVSLYNETDGIAIPPPPVVGGVGLIEDLDKVATLKGAQAGDVLILIGETKGHLGASLYAREILGLDGDEAGPPPPVDLEAEKKNADFVRDLIERGLVNAVHDVSDGGVACAAAEMALAANLGFDTKFEPFDLTAHFGELGGRILVAAHPNKWLKIMERGSEIGIDARNVYANFYLPGVDQIQFVEWDRPLDLKHSKDDLPKVVREDTISLSRIREAHEDWLPTYMSKVD